uniref:Uncharacterized protein n=1 Tax=Hyaloperonospora arabidopsidis (strain Emoy2) TaxID=559515 RepID=M4BY50_HYAAE
MSSNIECVDKRLWLSLLSSVIFHWDGKASRAGVVKQLPIAKFERNMRLLVPDRVLRPSEAESSLDGTLLQEEQNTVEVHCSSCGIDWRLGP